MQMRDAKNVSRRSGSWVLPCLTPPRAQSRWSPPAPRTRRAPPAHSTKTDGQGGGVSGIDSRRQLGASRLSPLLACLHGPAPRSSAPAPTHPQVLDLLLRRRQLLRRLGGLAPLPLQLPPQLDIHLRGGSGGSIGGVRGEHRRGLVGGLAVEALAGGCVLKQQRQTAARRSSRHKQPKQRTRWTSAASVRPLSASAFQPSSTSVDCSAGEAGGGTEAGRPLRLGREPALWRPSRMAAAARPSLHQAQCAAATHAPAACGAPCLRPPCAAARAAPRRRRAPRSPPGTGAAAPASGCRTCAAGRLQGRDKEDGREEHGGGGQVLLQVARRSSSPTALPAVPPALTQLPLRDRQLLLDRLQRALGHILLRLQHLRWHRGVQKGGKAQRKVGSGGYHTSLHLHTGARSKAAVHPAAAHAPGGGPAAWPAAWPPAPSAASPRPAPRGP